MKSTIGAIALIGGVMATAAAVALTGSAAFAGTNAVESSQKRIHAEWDKIRAQRGRGKDTAVTSQAADTRKNFTGVSSIFGPIEFGFSDPGLAEVGSNYGQNLRSGTRYGNGAWSGNFRGGRQHDRAEN